MIIKKLNSGYLVVLDQNQPVVSTLTEIVISQNIRGGSITGIGAVKDVHLGYYDLHKRDYLRKSFMDEDFELIALNGNITLKEGCPYVHVHTAIGDSEFRVFGGHMFEATVAVTAEVFITPFGSMPERAYSEQLGLATIHHCPHFKV